MTLGNGLRERYGFDPTSQLLSNIDVLDDANHKVSSLGYSYYENGQLLERTLSSGGVDRSRTLTYDDAQRLETVTEAGPGALDETFVFSPGGRLKSRTKFGTYTYDDEHPHALAAAAGNEFSYDARGNQETRTGPNIPGTTQTISYNRFNLPSQVLFGADPEHPERTIDFEYDADGSRVVKREANGGPEVLSLGDEYERTTGGDDSPGVQHKFRIFAAGREVAQVIYNETTGTPDILYLHRDQQTSVLLTTNAAGEASEVRDFDVFGDPVATPSWADTTKGAFTGHQRDVELGLVNAGARLYDATFGVFASADPLRVSGAGSQGFNPYAYANNDPVNLIDPTGLQAIDDQPVEINPDGSTVFTVYGCRLGTICDGYGGAGAGSSGAVADFLNWAPGGDLSRQELEDIPSGYQAPGLRHPNAFSYWREGEVVDTSETLKAELTIAMGVVNLFEIAGAGLAWLSTKAFVKGAEIAAREGAVVGAGASRGLGVGGNIRHVNPTSGTMNCANCAVATDATLAGSPASALPGSVTSAAQLAKELGGKWVQTSGPSGIAQTMQAAGSGARGIVLGTRGGGIGHFFNVTNQGGVVRFLDGQSGGGRRIWRQGTMGFGYFEHSKATNDFRGRSC